ncbi:MAG: drug/metabolite exporter YedA [Ktedonobacteraceae bacterium]
MSETYQTQPIPQEQAVETDIARSTPAPKAQKGSRWGILLSLFALYIIWGSTYLGMRFALESFPPFLMAGIRFLVAGILLYTFLRVRGVTAPTRSQILGSAIIGILLLAGGNGGVSFAEQWVSSGLAAVGIAAVPLWAALFIGLMGRWPKRIEWLGLGLGFVGVLFLNFENGVWANPIGAVALLLAPMCWALGSALSARISLPAGLMASATQMLIGGTFLLGLGLLLGERITSFPTVHALWAMVFLIFFGSLVAFSAYGYLLRTVRPALATSYAYVNPAVAVGLGVVFANEHITLIGVFAMVIILVGVGLVSLGRDRK